MDKTPKKIEIVHGNGKNEDGENLEISPVSEYLKIAKPKTKDEEKNKKIIVPKEKK